MEMRQQIARALIIAVVVMVCGFASMYEVSSGFYGNAFANEPPAAEGTGGPDNDGEPNNPANPGGTGDPQDPDDPANPGGTGDPQDPDDPPNSGDPDDPEETPLERTMRLIAALPSDPGKITESNRAEIEEAQAAYDALSASDKALVDTTLLGKTDQSYGRWLEVAQWGLLAHLPVNSSIGIADGDYSAYVTSSSSMGKSTSQRNKKWIAVKLMVRNGQTWAVLQCETTSALRTMCAGGVEYTANVVNEVPEFEVPVEPNGTTTVTIKANNISDSIAVQVNVLLPLRAASANEIAQAKKKAQAAAQDAPSRHAATDAAAIIEAAKALSDIASKTGVTSIEIQVAAKALDDVIAAAKPLPDGGASSSSSSSSSSGSNGSNGSNGSSASSNSSDSSGSSGSSSSSKSDASKESKGRASASSSGSSSKGITGRGLSQVVPDVSNKTKQAKSSSSKKTSSKSSASKNSSKNKDKGKSKSKGSASSGSSAKSSSSSPKSTEELEAEAAAGAQADQAAGVPIDKSANKSSPEFWMKVVTAGGVLALLLLGMCARTYLFARAKEVK